MSERIICLADEPFGIELLGLRLAGSIFVMLEVRWDHLE
jgi:hypothetical protein